MFAHIVDHCFRRITPATPATETARPPRVRAWMPSSLALLAALSAAAAPAQDPPAVPPPSRTMEKDLGDAGQLMIPSLNINEAELDDVLVALAQFSGLNIISGVKTKGKVSIYWQNVTVQEALEALLEANELGYIYKNGIVRVLPASKLGEDDVIHVTRVIKLNYLNAAEIARSLTDVTSDKGAIQVNAESNSLVVTDKPERVAQIVDIVREMDVRFLQVVIEAQLWEVSFKDSSSVGIDWSILDADPANRADFNLGNAGSSVLNQVLPGGSLQFGFVRDNKTFAGFLNALRKNSDINVLAHPYIVARNNKEASIQLEDQLPFVESSISNGVITESVNYQNVGIRLSVTPHITNDDHIIMDLRLSQRIPGPSVQLQNSTAFAVDQRIEETTLIIPDGRIVVIGGLFDTETSYSIDKVPMLGDLPIFGHLFRRRSMSKNRTDLMMSITPHIVRDPPPLTPDQQYRLEQFDRQRNGLGFQLSELEEKERANHGGIGDKILDDTANNLPQVWRGEDAKPVREELIPSRPYARPPHAEAAEEAAAEEAATAPGVEPPPEGAPTAAEAEAGTPTEETPPPAEKKAKRKNKRP